MEYKRRRLGQEQFADQIPYAVVYPSLESTLVLETGGNTNLNPGENTTSLSGHITGVQRIIYNDPFFSNDLFTTTLQNSLVGLIVSFYIDGDFTTKIIPICLPRQVLRHDMSENFMEKKQDFLKIQRSIAYALNLLFSKNLYAIGAGTVLSQVGVNTHAFPICQTAVLPPLVWGVTETTGQLYLARNNSFVHPSSDYDVAFNLITLTSQFKLAIDENGQEMLGKNSGWFAKGSYIYGFGSLDHTNSIYTDEYAQESRAYIALFLSSLADPTAIDFLDWQVGVVNQFKLKQNILMGSRTCSAIHGRYMSVNSQQISKIQRRPSVSNIDTTLTPSIGVIYTVIDYLGKYQNAKGTLSRVPFLQYSEYNYTTQEVDFKLINEFQDRLIIWNSNDYYQNNQILSEDIEFIPTAVPVPYQVLDPYATTNGPRYDCLFPYNRLTSNTFLHPLNLNQVWAGKPSLSFIHQFRVIGT